jgi:nitrogen fixation protein NifX
MTARHFRVIDSADATPPTSPAVRVAIATQDMKSLNAHFGAAKRIAVYDVTQDGWRFIEAHDFTEVSDQSGSHRIDGEDRISAKTEALAGCHLLFCTAIGGPSAAKVVAAKVHPIKTPKPAPIEEVLERTRAMLAGSPPPWLRKVLAQAGVTQKTAFAEED